MKNSSYLFLVVLFVIKPAIITAQSRAIEKAKQKIYTAASDEERLTSMLALCKLRNSLHGDTIFYYASLAKALALRLNDKKSLAWAEYSLISSDLAKGKTDSVVVKIAANKVFDGLKQTDAALYYKVQLLKANALNRSNNRAAALELQLKLLSEAENEGDINAQLFALNFIGATYLNINKQAEAKEAWVKGLEIIKDVKDSANNEIEGYILSNLALYYFGRYNFNKSQALKDSFLVAINHALELSAKNENLGVLASSHMLLGNFYGFCQQFPEGEKNFQQGLEVRKRIGDPYYIVDDIIAISNFYLNQQQYAKSIQQAKEGLLIAEQNGVGGLQQQLYYVIGTAYKSLGDYKEYSTVLERAIMMADSSNKINAAEKIADIQTKYEVQKKETLIARQQLDLFRRNIFLYGGGVLSLLLITYLAYRFKKYQQRQKLLAEEKRKQAELAVKDAEERERKRIAAELHDNLGVQANAILHSSSLLSVEKEDNKNIVEDLQDTAKEMLHNLRETLWAMKTTDVSATELWLRVINFMQQMGRRYTGITFKIGGEAPADFIIPSNKALNMMLILQEAVNNAVKHAGASSIKTSSLTDKNGWAIAITDNGKGFDTSAAQGRKNDSYGLANMQERATVSALQFTISSEMGIGTRVLLQV